MKLQTVNKILLAVSFVLALPLLAMLPFVGLTFLFWYFELNTPLLAMIVSALVLLFIYLCPFLLWLIGLGAYLCSKNKKFVTALLAAIIIIQFLYTIFKPLF